MSIQVRTLSDIAMFSILNMFQLIITTLIANSQVDTIQESCQRLDDGVGRTLTIRQRILSQQ